MLDSINSGFRWSHVDFPCDSTTTHSATNGHALVFEFIASSFFGEGHDLLCELHVHWTVTMIA